MAALIQREQRYVFSIALGVMREPHDAADMTQEAFVRMMRSLHTYRAETKFSTWLYRLVTNICLDGLRRRGRSIASLDLEPHDDVARAPSDLADVDRAVQPEAELELRESAAELRTALMELPTPQRLALTLHYFEELRYEEIADITGTPLNTVKSHIRRGKERLASILRDASRVEGRPRCDALT